MINDFKKKAILEHFKSNNILAIDVVDFDNEYEDVFNYFFKIEINSRYFYYREKIHEPLSDEHFKNMVEKCQLYIKNCFLGNNDKKLDFSDFYEQILCKLSFENKCYVAIDRNINNLYSMFGLQNYDLDNQFEKFLDYLENADLKDYFSKVENI